MLFEVGELVRVQNPKSKQWDATGEIAAVRVANDGRVLSYDINLTDGGTTIRHRKYLMKVKESLPAVVADSDNAADRGSVRPGADRDTADRGVMRPGAEGGLETSMAEAVTIPLADKARANARSDQLARLQPIGQTWNKNLPSDLSVLG